MRTKQTNRKTKVTKRLTDGSGSDLECMEIKDVLTLFFHSSDKVLLVGTILLWLKDPQKSSPGRSWWKCHIGVDPEEGLGDDLDNVRNHLHLVPLDVARALSKEERAQLYEWLKDPSEDKSLIPVGQTEAVKAGQLISVLDMNKVHQNKSSLFECVRLKSFVKWRDVNLPANKVDLIKAQCLDHAQLVSYVESVDPQVIPRMKARAMGAKLVKRVLATPGDTNRVISETLTAEENTRVKKNMELLNGCDDPMQDVFYLRNPGIIPSWLAEMLSSSERKAIIKFLLVDYWTFKHWTYICSSNFKLNMGDNTELPSRTEQQSRTYLETLPVKTVLVLFYHSPKAQLVAQYLNGLKNPGEKPEGSLSDVTELFLLTDEDEDMLEEGLMPKEVAEILSPEERMQLVDALRLLKSPQRLDRAVICLSPVGGFERQMPVDDDHICESTLLEKMDPQIWMNTEFFKQGNKSIKASKVRVVERFFHSARDMWKLETIDPAVIPQDIARAMGWSLASDILKNLPRRDEMTEEDKANYVMEVNGVEVVTKLPAYLARKMSISERKQVLQGLDILSHPDCSQPDKDSFLQINPGIIPSKVADLLTPHERRNMIDLMLTAWADQQFDLLDPKVYKKPQRDEPSCCWYDITKRRAANTVVKAPVIETRQPNSKRKQQRSNDPKETIFISRLTPDEAATCVPKEKQYIAKVILARMKQFTKTESFLELLQEAKRCKPRIVTDELIENIDPNMLERILSHHLLPEDDKNNSTIFMTKVSDIRNHREFIEANAHIIPPAFCSYIEQDLRVSIVEAANLRRKMRLEPFDEENFKRAAAHLMPKELAEVLTQSETECLVEELENRKRSDVVDMDIDASDESLVDDGNDSQSAGAAIPSETGPSKPKRMRLAGPPDNTSSSLLESMQPERAMRHFFNSDKATLVGKILAYLRTGQARKQGQNDFFPTCVSTDDEFIEQNAHLVPVEVARILNEEERRVLVDSLKDPSTTKSMSPLGIDYATHTMALISSGKISSVDGCHCEKTYMESLRQKKWQKFVPQAGKVLQELLMVVFEPKTYTIDEQFVPRRAVLAVGTRVASKYEKKEKMKDDRMKRKKHKWEMKELKKKTLAEAEVENMEEPDKENGDTGKSVEFEQENMDTNVIVKKEEDCHDQQDAPEQVIPIELLNSLTPDELNSARMRLEVISKAAQSNPKDDEFLQNNPGIIPLRVAEILTKHQRRQLIEGLIDAWSCEKWAEVMAKNKQHIVTMDDREVTSCCLRSPAIAQGHDKMLTKNAEATMAMRQQKECEKQLNLEEGKISYLETIPSNELDKLWRKGFPKIYFVKSAVLKITNSSSKLSEKIKKSLEEVIDIFPKHLTEVLGWDSTFLSVIRRLAKLKKGELQVKPSVAGAFERDDDFFEANKRILPKEILPAFTYGYAKFVISKAVEKQEFMKDVKFDEQLFQKHSFWIPRKVAELLTSEETEQVVDILREYKKNRDASAMVLPEPIPCVANAAKSNPDIAIKSEPSAVKKMRFLTGMKVRVSERTKNKEKVGLEGVLKEVGSITCVLQLPDQITTTVVRSPALDPFPPEVGEPCKMIVPNETEAVGRILDFVEEDFVFVQFDGETSCRKVNLCNLCRVA